MFKQFQKISKYWYLFRNTKCEPGVDIFVGKIGPTFDKYFFVFARQKDEILKAGDEV